jgi:beta-glucosidase
MRNPLRTRLSVRTTGAVAAALVLSCAAAAQAGTASATASTTAGNTAAAQTSAAKTSAAPPACPDGSGRAPLYRDTRYSFAERAADLVSCMTLAEKAAQLMSNSAPAIPRLGVQQYT